MNYEADRERILAERDFLRLSDELVLYAGKAADAGQQGDIPRMHAYIRLAHWVMFREADFKWHPLDLPIVDERTYALVADTPIEAFAAAIEIEPPPMTFMEALMLARASRGN